MRFALVVLLAVSLFIGCESPQDLSNEQTLYKGRVVLQERAPFVIDGNSLSKDSDGLLILDETVPDGTVYGLKNDDEVYAAEGGEVLPKKSWVDNVSNEPVEVSVTADMTISFEAPTQVTIVGAVDVTYIDVNGIEVVFTGSGVVEATQISTGSDGLLTIIVTAEFSIGGDDGENQ